MPDNSSPTTPDSINAARRHGQALELRAKGATFDQIAQLLNYSGKGAAHNAVMSELAKVVLAPAEDLVKLEVERLDSYLVPLSGKIKNGDTKAIDTALKVSERRSKLLGLDNFERRMAEVHERRVAVEEREALAVAAMLAGVLKQLDLPEDKLLLARRLISEGLRDLGVSRTAEASQNPAR